MADIATPAAVAASGIPVVVVASITGFAGQMGLDPASMGAGLGGVVIAQTLLPPTVQGLRAIVGLGIGSMLLASYGAPLAAPMIVGRLHEWQWLTQVPPEHLKALTAAFIGAFAQPILVWVRSLLPKRAATDAVGKVEP